MAALSGSSVCLRDSAYQLPLPVSNDCYKRFNLFFKINNIVLSVSLAIFFSLFFSGGASFIFWNRRSAKWRSPQAAVIPNFHLPMRSFEVKNRYTIKEFMKQSHFN